MAYNINLSNGDLLVTVEEGTSDTTTTSLSLIGKNYAGYGESLNENFVRILENFANATSPNSPLEGQIWYDTLNQQLKIYTNDGWGLAGSGVKLDQISSNLHYHVFVESDSGAPPFKTSKERGLVFQPSTGNFAIGKSTPGNSKLEINGSSVRTRGLGPPINIISLAETVVQIHGENNAAARMVIDSYGNGSEVGSTINLRRSKGSSNLPGGLGSGDMIGGFMAHGHDGSTYSTYSGQLAFYSDAAWTSTSHPTRLDIYLTSTNSTIASRKFQFLWNGDMYASGDIIAFSASDISLKTDIVKIDQALSKVNSLDGVSFLWNDRATGKDGSQRQAGVIAQQVQKVLPEAVQLREDGNLGVAYEKLVPLLIEAIKDLSQEVTELKTRLQ